MTRDEFLSLPWSVTPQGGYILATEGHTVSIVRAMTCSPTYGVTVDGVYTAHYNGARISDVMTAKLAAYEILSKE